MRAASPVTPKGTTASSVTKNVGFQQNCEPPWSNPGITLPGNCNSNLTGESPLVRSVSNASALTSLSADLSPSDSHFFEVLYIGKVRISQRKVPESLIDDALFKFSQHEAEKAKTLRRYSLLSSAGTSIYSNDSTETLNDEKSPENNESKNNIVASTTPLEPDKATPWKSTENLPVDKSNEIDQEFDMFTKERVEKNGQSKKPVPLEPSVVLLNVQKNNLGTVKEDEEKIDDKDNKTKSNPDIVKDVKEKVQSNLKVNDLIDITKETKDAQKVDKVRQDSPAPNKMNFNEIPQKPRGLKGLDERRSSMPENRPFLRDRSASIGTLNLKTPIAHLIGEQNRTMLFQVARSELRLISPDRKQILLHRAFRDVASCVLGRSNREHFGFVCRENNDSYACYVFKCESDSVAEEVVNAIRQAFVAHAELLKKSREKSPNMTCEHCPMLWYHRLCHDIEGMNEKKTHASILRRLEQLPEDEQDLIITKYQGGTNHMYETSEHNSFLMMLLRAHCEAKQQRHVHDTAENRSEFLNQYLGGNTIFMKARRSLSNGFDHLLKRKASKDEIFIPPAIVKKEASPHPSLPARLPTPAPELLTPPPAPAPAPRCKSLSPAALPDHSVSDMLASSKSSLTATLEEEEEEEPGTPVHSPMMEIYLKVSDSRPPPKEAGKESDTTWRQAIYEKAIRPGDEEGEMTSKTLLSIPSAPPGKRSKEQLRQLWKMAIDQTILLVRMEKENAKLRESEESSAVRRIKLEYRELGTCDTGVTLMWDSLLSRDHSQPIAKVDRYMLTQAVMQGVPRMSRGAVWYFLAEQASLRAPAAPACPRYHTPYATLLAGLTKHQHAILIDLGRTFPKHSYFASALGPGQLALYNILKAYSLLDPEVGYCQGLSFVAGVLLLHMEEAEAFVLLRHLMFRRGLRKQYLPDMSALQVQLYQLSRLLRDHEPELFAKLQSLDISPALYAAPWMLTLFTSQFPLGFVVRVFDLIFLDSFDVVFSVSLALLSAHRDGLMLCESCEEAAEYLKHKLADVNKVGCEKILKKIHTLDIKQQLTEYAVEYAVLREEMPRLATLTEENRRLVADANKMTEELDSAMDAITNFQKSQARMESSNKGMEQQLTLLSRYISAYHRQDMPPEIKRIVNNYSKKLSFSSKITSFSSKFTSNEDDDDGKKHLKTGISAPNLFAKISRDDVMNAVNKDRNASPDKEKPDKRMTMKKSLSVHSGLLSSNLKQYPLKVLEEKSENEYKKSDSMRNDRIITESLKELSRRNAGFFANTHEQIRQERFFEQQLKRDFDENLKKLDEKLSSKSYIDDLSIFQSRKSMSLNLNSSTKENKLNDSGFVTPLTPADDKKDDTCSIVSHPLSDCDVEITDLQSTKLKQIRTTRMGSANSIEK